MYFVVANSSSYLVYCRVCFQMSESSSGVREFLEEFLSKWRFANERYYVLAGAESNIDDVEGCDGCFVLGVGRYLDVVEIYVMKLLGATPNDMSLAITWVDKAELPEDKRQVTIIVGASCLRQPSTSLIDMVAFSCSLDSILCVCV